MTDVLGICESWEAGTVVVRREKGDVVTIPVADIVSGKPVPPRPSPHRRLGAVEADRLAMPGWRAAETEPLGEWWLRASGGFSNRANSVLALGDPGLPLEAALRRVTDWYARRSLSPRAHAHAGSEVAASLEGSGWTAYEPTTLMLASVARALRRTTGPDVEVRHAMSLDDGWLATDERATRFGAAARQVLESGDVTLATVRDDRGEVLARGRGAHHADWVGVASLWTRPEARGHGLGTAVLRSLLEWGAERGATTAYLQVVEANPEAMDLYGRRGFEPHHSYTYYVLGG